jgi:predicted RecA/RadA family phage recombinase
MEKSMKAVYVQKGDSIDHTPSSDVAAGDVVIIGEKTLGIAKLDIKANELGALSLVGVFDVAKEAGTGTALAAGINVYWDATNQVVTSDANGGANINMGRTIAPATDDDTTARVRLRQ